MSEPFQPPSPLAHTPRLTSASGPGAPTDLPTDLTQLLATARASRATAVAQLLQQAEQTSNAARTTVGVEHLLFVCANIPCAVPLTDLREALPTLPQTTPLPFSAPWLLGIFPLRTEVIGLADPIPLLLGRVRPIPGNAIEWATWSANQPWALQADAALAAVGALAEPWRWGAWLHGEGVDVFGVSGPRNHAEQSSQFATLFASSAPTGALARALLVGEGARSLALVVNALGAITRVQESELCDDLSVLPALPFQARYVAGAYMPKPGSTPGDTDETALLGGLPQSPQTPQPERRYLVLRLRALLDDMLTALEQEGAS